MNIADRVRERLDALKMTPVDAARRAGLARTFVSDLLLGKKRSVRGEGLMLLAEVLQVDAEYLIGSSNAPRPAHASPSEIGAEGVPIAGICEAGVWRRTESIPDLGRIPVSADLRYIGREQRAFLVRGAGGARLGITDGMIVCGVVPTDGSDVEAAGAPLVVRQRRASGEVETSIRMIEAGLTGAMLVAPSDERIDPIPFPPADRAVSVEIAAVVMRAIRLFGLPS